MPTLQIQAEVTPQMVTQMVQTMTEEELRLLERELKNEQLRRFSPGIAQDENALLERALRKPPHAERWEQLIELRTTAALSDQQRDELTRIIEAREADNIERVAVVMRLAALRGEKFEALWAKLGLAPQQRRRVSG